MGTADAADAVGGQVGHLGSALVRRAPTGGHASEDSRVGDGRSVEGGRPAATATFASLPDPFTVLATIATTQEGADPAAVAARTLHEARTLGLDGLRREDSQTVERCRRKHVARARIGGQRSGHAQLSAPQFVRPSLRQADGYYGDVPLCSVGSTKFCFQDAGLWHADFHLNEIRAESMLTLGQYEELLPFCRLIRALLPQSQENARDVNSKVLL